jgi:hypothetical protein
LIRLEMNATDQAFGIAHCDTQFSVEPA